MSNEERRKENIEKVLCEALKCYKEFGVGATPSLLLAKRTGLTVRSINRYFPSKSDLAFQAAGKYLRETTEIIAQEYEKFQPNSKKGLEQLLLLLSVVYELYKAQRVDVFLQMEMERCFVVYGNRSPNYKCNLEQVAKNRLCIQQAIEIGIEDGSIRAELDAHKAATLIDMEFYGILKRFAIHNKIKADCQMFDEIIEESFEQIKRYVRAPFYQESRKN